MKNIKLNNEISINLPKLIDSRLLVQANSGAGKSWLLRRILEQSHGKVQQIVIDLEGEFSTLREKFDYILAGKGGDTPATPQSAALLARKLLELNVSAIIDLYELPHQDRKRFVRLFLESMINAPKELWHPVLIVIDEAHVFVPEKGESEAASAVIDLATRGRKRGFCAVLATQRISKLHKDAAAECNNKLIGRAAQDIDMKRSSDELGFTSHSQQLSLRTLEAGEFYGFGPAISNEVIKLKIGDVQTSHPKAGSRSLTEVVPPTDKIKSILGKLADLPAEAKKEAQTVAEMKEEIGRLKNEVRIAHRDIPKITPVVEKIKVKEVLVLKDSQISRLEKVFEKMFKEANRHGEAMSFLWAHFNDLGEALSKALLAIKDSKNIPVSHEIPKRPVFVNSRAIDALDRGIESIRKQNKAPTHVLTVEGMEVVDKPLVGGAIRMIKVLASRYPIRLTRSQLATFAKMKSRGGSFNTYLSALRTKGYIKEEGDLFVATEAGIDYTGESPNPPSSTEEVIEMWRSNLTGKPRSMFDFLVDNRDQMWTKDAIAQAVGMTALGGSFNTYLSILRSNGLIKTGDGLIGLSDSLFI